MKIAIFSIYSQDEFSGGVEKFNTSFVKKLQENSRTTRIDFFPYFKTKDNSNSNTIYALAEILNGKRVNVFLKGRKISELFTKVEKEYDWIFISGGFFYLSRIWKSKKVIFFAHLEEKAFKKYNQFFWLFRLVFNSLSIFLFRKSRIVNPYKKFNNDRLYPVLNTNNKNSMVLIDEDEHKITSFSNWKKRSNNMLYIGRIEQKQKNIAYLKRVSKFIKVDVFGKGPSEKVLINHQNIELKGFAKPENIYKNYKFLVIPSNYEGSPYIISEAISNGLFVLAKDSFETAKFYKKITSKTNIRVFHNIKEFRNNLDFILNISKPDYEHLQKETAQLVKMIKERNDSVWANLFKLIFSSK